MGSIVDLNGFMNLLVGIYAALGIVTVVASVGMAWGVVRGTMREITRRVVSLEDSRGNIYTRLNAQGTGMAEIKGKLDMLIEETRKQR